MKERSKNGKKSHLNSLGFIGMLALHFNAEVTVNGFSTYSRETTIYCFYKNNGSSIFHGMFLIVRKELPMIFRSQVVTDVIKHL